MFLLLDLFDYLFLLDEPFWVGWQFLMFSLIDIGLLGGGFHLLEVGLVKIF